MPKSASTFAFQLAKDIAESHSNQSKLRQLLPQELQCNFQTELDKTIQKIDEVIPDEEIYVIKTHCSLNEEVKALLVKGHAKAMVSYRNPYDIVVSLKDAGERERSKPVEKQRKYFTQIKTYEDALSKIPGILKIGEFWLKYPNILKIPFSRIAKDPLTAAQEIADYMGVSTANLSQIVESYVLNKKSIGEFNIGKEGRGHIEFSLSEDNDIKKKMDKFVMLYLEPLNN